MEKASDVQANEQAQGCACSKLSHCQEVSQQQHVNAFQAKPTAR
jgi:hypothetical protein